MKSKHVFVLAALAAATAAHAQVISWNLDRYGTLTGSDLAGIVAVSNWNNSWPTDPTVDLIDDTGAATTLDIAYASFNQWSVDGANGPTPGQDADGTYNRNLLNGYLNAGPASWNPPVIQSTVTLTEIPYDWYNIIVYFSADVAGREGQVTIGSTTYYFSTVGLASVSDSNALFAQTTSTSNLDYTTANYAVFTVLSGATQTITVEMRDNDEWGGIAGFQVVAVPEPSTTAALLGGLGVLWFCGRFRRCGFFPPRPLHGDTHTCGYCE